MAGRETPATRAAKAAGIQHGVHEYVHDPAADSYALEAAEALGLDPARVFKTLVVAADGGADGLTVCIVPSAATLDLRAVGKRAAMAPAERAERVTGYVAGRDQPARPAARAADARRRQRARARHRLRQRRPPRARAGAARRRISSRSRARR